MINSDLSTFEDVRISHVEEVEEWKDVVDWEGFYEVSNYGVVRSVARWVEWNGTSRFLKGKVLKGALNYKGYKYYSLSKDGNWQQYKAHRLVAFAFIPNPLGFTQINHIDGNKLNNFYKNLEWCNGSMNMRHAFDNNLVVGRRQQNGEKNSMSKLGEKEVNNIFRLKDLGFSQCQIAVIYDVSQANVAVILGGNGWKHLNLSDEEKTATEGTLDNT